VPYPAEPYFRIRIVATGSGPSELLPHFQKGSLPGGWRFHASGTRSMLMPGRSGVLTILVASPSILGLGRVLWVRGRSHSHRRSHRK
jgi:hypothetical protein